MEGLLRGKRSRTRIMMANIIGSGDARKPSLSRDAHRLKR